MRSSLSSDFENKHENRGFEGGPVGRVNMRSQSGVHVHINLYLNLSIVVIEQRVISLIISYYSINTYCTVLFLQILFGIKSGWVDFQVFFYLSIHFRFIPHYVQFVYSTFQVDFPVNYYLRTMNKRKYSTKVQLNNRIIASQVTVNTMSLPIIHSVKIGKLRIVLMTLDIPC